MLQSSFFDLEDKFKKLDEKDPLIKLTQLIDWEMFRSTLEKVREKERKSNAVSIYTTYQMMKRSIRLGIVCHFVDSLALNPSSLFQTLKRFGCFGNS